MRTINAAIGSAIGSAINAAIGNWTGADWPHYYAPPCGGPETTRECDGDEGCQTCLDALDAARGAEEMGREALAALAVGDLGGVVTALKSAVSLENQFGDSPTWGKSLRLAQAALDEARHRRPGARGE